jgi:acid phosphatase family membrane protein YuiD
MKKTKKENVFKDRPLTAVLLTPEKAQEIKSKLNLPKTKKIKKKS